MTPGFEREWEKDELGKVRRKKGVTSTREGASEEAGDATVQQVVEKGKGKGKRGGSRSVLSRGIAGLLLCLHFAFCFCFVFARDNRFESRSTTTEFIVM
jgi:hypothetical protein